MLKLSIMVDKRLNKNLRTRNNNGKSMEPASIRGRFFSAENREIIREIKEIKKLQEQTNSEVKEVKRLLIFNNFRRLVDNYDKINQLKQKKLEKEWELAIKDKQRNKEIAEWDRIQAEDEKNLSS